MLVNFIAHAGVSIKEKGGLVFGKETSLLIDPWFTDSTVEKPIMEVIYGYPTIDFQIPKTIDRTENYTPNIILLSHLHAHHSPAIDLFSLAGKSKKLIIAHPDLGEKNAEIKNRFAQFPQVELRPSLNGNKFTVGNFHITAIEHTVKNHLAWYVVSSSGSVLHITDAKLNRDSKKREIDEVWKSFENLNPNLLLISAGGNSNRREKEGKRYILEASCLTPVEGANITKLINPKVVSLIGIYNHSIWKNRTEFIPPTSFSEDAFHWATSWLSPEIKCVFMKPGHTFGIGDVLLATDVDTYIN